MVEHGALRRNRRVHGPNAYEKNRDTGQRPQSPYFTAVFAFSGKIELSQHSALMGGQFTTKKCSGTFKNPIFYAGGRGANLRKNELSLLMVQNSLKNGFFHKLTT
jgi:hypothetical protein